MLRAIQGGKGISAVDGMNRILMQLCFDVISFFYCKGRWKEEMGVDKLTTENDWGIA